MALETHCLTLEYRIRSKATPIAESPRASLRQLLTSEKGRNMYETNETFTERVDVTTQLDGAFIGTMETEVRPSDRREEQLRTLKDECDRLPGRGA